MPMRRFSEPDDRVQPPYLQRMQQGYACRTCLEILQCLCLLLERDGVHLNQNEHNYKYRFFKSWSMSLLSRGAGPHFWEVQCRVYRLGYLSGRCSDPVWVDSAPDPDYILQLLPICCNGDRVCYSQAQIGQRDSYKGISRVGCKVWQFKFLDVESTIARNQTCLWRVCVTHGSLGNGYCPSAGLTQRSQLSAKVRGSSWDMRICDWNPKSLLSAMHGSSDPGCRDYHCADPDWPSTSMRDSWVIRKYLLPDNGDISESVTSRTQALDHTGL